MTRPKIIVPLLFVAALAAGCASTEARYSSNDYRNGAARSHENFYAVIDSIESGEASNESPAQLDGGVVGREIGKASGQNAYFIRIRFDDRTYQTVAQASLDGLRVGDSVRIEHGRVRRY